MNEKFIFHRKIKQGIISFKIDPFSRKKLNKNFFAQDD